MPLRNTVKGFPETLSDMLLAADDRYREAEALLVEHEFDGCVYLLGYAAEMWLKAACLRLRGLSATVLVKGALPPLKKWMQSTVPSTTFTDYHDLSYLAECVFQLRLAQGRPLAVPLAVELRTLIVSGLHGEWIVDMRYRRSGLSAADAWSALSQAWWMKNNWLSLT
ncbi:MAG: hypothetical protein JWO87_3055 [Phycisphaerales bacterium]|nr:hypothetical protein [Phycisphaerales bacterium]